MSDLKVINQDGQLLVDSRDVAEKVGKGHGNLVRDIRMYAQIIENSNLSSRDFFTPSAYRVDGNNRSYAHYFLTRKGCDMVANKMTGEKGVLFTAAYVTKFEEMEQQTKILPLPQMKTSFPELDKAAHLLSLLRDHSSVLDEATKKVIQSQVNKLIAGKNIVSDQKTTLNSGATASTSKKSKEKSQHVNGYKARHIAEISGTTPQKVGRTANQHGLKIPKYGYLHNYKFGFNGIDQSVFIYNELGKNKLLELLMN